LKKTFLKFHLIYVKIFDFLAFFVASVESLSCYQCLSHGSEPCPDEDLKECPTNQAYDRCSVEMMKKRDQPLVIKRECALAPCNLRDKAIDTIIKLRESCDMSKDEFNCWYCCKEDGCNRDDGSHTSPSRAMIISAAILCVFFLITKNIRL
ncbi:hypothetical protein B4U79_09774, partial [Dinothrombium tinctorium]